MNTTGKIIAAAAAGVAIGAVLGILLAPDKGIETRRKMSEEGKKFADDLKDTMRKGKEKFTSLKDEFEQMVKEKAEQFDRRNAGEGRQV